MPGELTIRIGGTRRGRAARVGRARCSMIIRGYRRRWYWFCADKRLPITEVINSGGTNRRLCAIAAVYYVHARNN